MGVCKGTKNNQNSGIIPGLSHYLVECNLIQEYAHTGGGAFTCKTRMLLLLQELTKN